MLILIFNKEEIESKIFNKEEDKEKKVVEKNVDSPVTSEASEFKCLERRRRRRLSWYLGFFLFREEGTSLVLGAFGLI